MRRRPLIYVVVSPVLPFFQKGQAFLHETRWRNARRYVCVHTCTLAYTLECILCILDKLKEVFMHCMNPQRMRTPVCSTA